MVAADAVPRAIDGVRGGVSAPHSDLAIGHEKRAGNTPLRTAVRSGAREGVLSGLLTQLLSVAATLVLARLLTPGDFGLVAAAQSVMGLALALSQIGLRASVMRRPQIDQTAASTYFWAGIGIGLVIAGTVAGTSAIIAQALDLKAAAPLIAVLSLSLVWQLAIGVPDGLLRRNLRFRSVYAIEVLTAACYVSVQLALAVAGMGAMAVVIGQVTSATIAFVAVMVCSRWRPTLEFRPTSLRGELGYNAGMLGTSFTTYLGKNLDYWFVGRLCGPAALGVYYVAFVLPNILRQRITTVAGSVMFPVFVRHQHDPAQLSRTYVESFGLHLMAGVPAMCGLSLVADDVVAVFFGSQWSAAGTPLAILSLAAAAEFVTAAAISMLLATGRTRDTVLLQLFRAAVLTGGLITLSWSPGGLDPARAAAVVLGSTAAAALAAQVLACRRLGISPHALFVGLRAVLPPTAVMAAGLWGIQRADVGSHALSLAGSAVCGAALFLAAGLLFGRRPFRALLAECLRIALPERVHARLTSLEVRNAG